MVDALEESFSLQDLEISPIEELTRLPNVDNITTCQCCGRYCCLRENGRNFCPCKSMDKYCSNVCHGSDLWPCMNNPKLEESDSEESDDTMVRFDFNLILFGLFNDQYIFL
jgi:hypothetical protein